MNLKNTRADFPFLRKKINNKPLIYLDNASMSLKPQQVIDAMNDYYCNYSVAAGRSAYKLAKNVTERCEEVRKNIQNFIHAELPEEIIFTKNTTEGINVVARGMELNAGDIVVTTDKEHNSNLVPWHEMQRLKRIRHEIVPSNEDNTFNLEMFKNKMNKKVKLVSMVHCSNLDGCTIPAEEIIEIAHDCGATVMLDDAQSAPHKSLNMKKLDVDFSAFSLHKMLGPTGMGVLYGKYDLLKNMSSLFLGGNTIEEATYERSVLLKLPKKFEGGLQNYAGIIGAGKAIDYLNNISMEEIEQQDYKLNKYITERLKDISGVKIIGPEEPKLRAGIFSFNIESVSPNTIALEFDRKKNIMIRSGFHCVDSWFNSRNINGSARVSTYFYNTLDEVKLFVEQIETLMEKIHKCE